MPKKNKVSLRNKKKSHLARKGRKTRNSRKSRRKIKKNLRGSRRVRRPVPEAPQLRYVCRNNECVPSATGNRSYKECKDRCVE